MLEGGVFRSLSAIFECPPKLASSKVRASVAHKDGLGDARATRRATSIDRTRQDSSRTRRMTDGRDPVSRAREYTNQDGARDPEEDLPVEAPDRVPSVSRAQTSGPPSGGVTTPKDSIFPMPPPKALDLRGDAGVGNDQDGQEDCVLSELGSTGDAVKAAPAARVGSARESESSDTIASVQGALGGQSMAIVVYQPSHNAVLSTTVAPRTEKGKPRSPDEIRAESKHDGFDPPQDLKLGYWKSKDDVEDYLKEYARNRDLGGGGFTLTKPRGVRKGAYGLRWEFVCKHACTRRKGKGCPYRVCLEHSSEGWMVKQGCFRHEGHQLSSNLIEALCEPGQRGVPKQYESIVADLGDASVPVPDIMRVLGCKARKDKVEMTWVYDDIFNAVRPDPFNRKLDAAGYVEFLMRREREEGLPFQILTNPSSEIVGSFYLMEDGEKLWSQHPGILLFDTSHNCNSYGQKLGLLSSIDNFGNTTILATSVVASETVSSFAWVFRCFLTHLHIAPRVVITDGDQSMARAIKEELPSTRHDLCIWHVAKLVHQHCQTCFSGTRKAKSKYRKVTTWESWYRQWWSVVQNSDESMKERFENEWTLLTNKLPRDVDPTTKEWFANLGKKATRFAYTYTWAHRRLGINSTQRAEAMHSAVKKLVGPRTSMREMAEALDLYCRTRKIMAGVQAVKSAQLALRMKGTSPAISALKPQLTKYAVDMMMAQFDMSSWYSVSPADDSALKRVTRIHVNGLEEEEDDYGEDEVDRDSNLASMGLLDHGHVSHLTSLTTCSCQYPKAMGLPCRHIFAVMRSSQEDRVAEGVVCGFWRKRSARAREKSLEEFRLMKFKKMKDSVSEEKEEELDYQTRFDLAMTYLKPLARLAAEIGTDAVNTVMSNAITQKAILEKKLKKDGSKDKSAYVNKDVNMNGASTSIVSVTGVAQVKPIKPGKQRTKRGHTGFDLPKGKRGKKK